MYKNNKLSRLVDVRDELAVRDEVKTIMTGIYPGSDFTHVNKTLFYIVNLFDGHNPHYKRCNTPYHDLSHTFSVFLAMGRLMHGYQAAHKHDEYKRISEKGVRLGLESALFHETGLLQSIEENMGNGARFMTEHVERGIRMMEQYFKGLKDSKEDIIFRRNNIQCTDLSKSIDEIGFSSPEERLVSQMLGTADLLGQMSDPNYIDKLPYLYLEFQEGKIKGYDTVLDLIRDHRDFHEKIMIRLEQDLGNMKSYMIHHFREYRNINEDLYEKGIRKNLRYSNKISNDPGNFLKRLEKDKEFMRGLIRLRNMD